MKKQFYEQQVKEYYPDAYCAENAVSHKFVIINGIDGPTLSKKHHKYEENAWKEIDNQLKDFNISVTQQVSTMVHGVVPIKARNEQIAIQKVKKMLQKQLKKKSIAWQAFDDFGEPTPTGDIEVWE